MSKGPQAVKARLRGALPTPREAVWGTLSWVMAICANVALALALHGWSLAASAPVISIFLLGAGMAFVPALVAARLIAGRRGQEIRFAALVACLAAATVGITGAIYAWDYRLYYAQWHAAPFTHIWFLQFVFTGLVALYQFAAVGLRLMFPFGFVALLVGSYLLSKPRR